MLDPSYFPATGTPEAGGVSFHELQAALKIIYENFNIVGCDLVEYSPPYDNNGVCAATMCKIVRELLLALNTKGRE